MKIYVTKGISVNMQTAQAQIILHINAIFSQHTWSLGRHIP